MKGLPACEKEYIVEGTNQEDKGMAEDERAYQRQKRAYKVLYPVAKAAMRLLLNYRTELAPHVDGPCLVLSNHVTDFDPFLVGLSFPEHMYFVAGENVLRMGFLSKLASRYASLIQRVKGTTDAEAALQIVRTLKKGRNVCMFAEGNRTFTGETLPIAPATAKLVRLSRSTLVTYRLTGGYLSTPRWSTHRRKGRLTGAVVGVYSPETLKQMSEAAVSELLARDLYENAYETQANAPVAFRGKALAETLETALYLCPRCRRIDTLHSRGDRFFCDCGLSVSLDEYGFFQGKEAPFQTPLAWDKWQEKEMAQLAGSLSSEPAFFDEEQTLNRREEDHRLTPLTTGRMALYRDKLTVGERIFPLKDVRGIGLIQRQGMVFSTAEGDYAITAARLRCVRKYQTLFEILKGMQ